MDEWNSGKMIKFTPMSQKSVFQMITKWWWRIDLPGRRTYWSVCFTWITWFNVRRFFLEWGGRESCMESSSYPGPHSWKDMQNIFQYLNWSESSILFLQQNKPNQLKCNSKSYFNILGFPPHILVHWEIDLHFSLFSYLWHIFLYYPAAKTLWVLRHELI